MSVEPAGVRLKKIRLERGLSLEEVHKHTRIHLNILKAIEEDSLINLNPVYIKGFLKIYCKFLGLDPKDYIDGYREVRTMHQAVQHTAERKKFSPGLKPKLRTAAFIRGLRRQRRKILAAAGIIVFVFLVFNIGKAVSGRRSSMQAGITQFNAEKRSEAQKKQTNSRHSEASSKEEALSIIRLAIRARENCLVQLKIDGKVVFYGTLARGRTESWHAKNKMELYLGNAGVVDLEVNGKPISNLGKRGQAIKNITISKEGLEIGR